jgi:prepilin-type N-terminal cleavage/methylation domain-containing protein
MDHLIQKKGTGGFTLIELLVVVAIITMLSTIIFNNLASARQKALTVRTHSDMREIQNQVDLTRYSRDKTVRGITSDDCTFCVFADGQPIMSQAGALLSNNDAWVKLGFRKSPLDAWGRPYIFDENESDPGFPSCTVHDVVYTVGKNGIWESYLNSSDQSAPANQLGQGLGDDYFFNLTFYNCPGA